MSIIFGFDVKIKLNKNPIYGCMDRAYTGFACIYIREKLLIADPELVLKTPKTMMIICRSDRQTDRD